MIGHETDLITQTAGLPQLFIQCSSINSFCAIIFSQDSCTNVSVHTRVRNDLNIQGHFRHATFNARAQEQPTLDAQFPGAWAVC